MPQLQWLAGVDEAGRGPLAGPVAIGVAVVPYDFDWTRMQGVGDSKKVSQKNREAVFLRANALRKTSDINFAVALVSARVIDRVGIVEAVQRGIHSCFKKLKLNPDTTTVRLDGLLRAPRTFLSQETIVKGDVKEKVIGLASILAKVTRDAHMVVADAKFPQYQFGVHKGYGTKKHRDCIRKLGLSSIHRRTYCTKLTP